MQYFLQALLKRTSLLLILLGIVMLIIAAATEIIISSFTLRITSLPGQIIIGAIGLGLISLGVYFEIKQLANSMDKGIETSARIKAKDFFLTNFSKQLEVDFESAQDVWIVGISVRQLIQYVTIEQKLQKGHNIKVLIVHPDSIALEMAEARVHGRMDIEQRRANNLSVLKDLCKLQKQHPKRLEVRTIDILLSYRIIAINPLLEDKCILYFHYYPYKAETNQFPKFVVTPDDDYWCNFFRQELINLWSSGQNWNCSQIQTTMASF